MAVLHNHFRGPRVNSNPHFGCQRCEFPLCNVVGACSLPDMRGTPESPSMARFANFYFRPGRPRCYHLRHEPTFRLQTDFQLRVRVWCGRKPARVQTALRRWIGFVHSRFANHARNRAIHFQFRAADLGLITHIIVLTAPLWSELIALRANAAAEDPVFPSRTGKRLDRGRVREAFHLILASTASTDKVSQRRETHYARVNRLDSEPLSTD